MENDQYITLDDILGNDDDVPDNLEPYRGDTARAKAMPLFQPSIESGRSKEKAGVPFEKSNNVIHVDNTM